MCELERRSEWVPNRLLKDVEVANHPGEGLYLSATIYCCEGNTNQLLFIHSFIYFKMFCSLEMMCLVKINLKVVQASTWIGQRACSDCLFTRQANVICIMGPICDVKLSNLLFFCVWRRLLRFRAHICVGLLAVVIDVDTDCTNVKPVQVQTDIWNVNFN